MGNEKVRPRPRGQVSQRAATFMRGRKKLSGEQRDGGGEGRCQQRQHGDEGARAGDKDNKTKKWQLQKATGKKREKKRKNPPGRYQPRAFAETEKKKQKKRELSVCLFGPRPLRNNYSLLITIWRKGTRRSGLGSLRCLHAGRLARGERRRRGHRAGRRRTRGAMLSPFARSRAKE